MRQKNHNRDGSCNRRLLAMLWIVLLCAPWPLAADTQVPAARKAARTFPDYSGVTVPPNIAPLNFRIDEPGRQYRVELRSARGMPVVVSGRSAVIQFPLEAWRRLVRTNAGQELLVDISVQDQNARWTRFATITNRIAAEPVDSHLAYRLLKPLYNAYSQLGIYQRDLESFDQAAILRNDKFEGGCLNCHTPWNQSPATFAFNTRGATGEQPMMLVLSNEIARVEKTMGYLAWHPSGRLIAFSANKLSLFSHTLGETRDVYDAQSNLGIYRVDSNEVSFPPAISVPDKNETWPAWSPDGRYLYFSSAAPLPLEKFRRIRYDLMRAAYDLENDSWGPAETVVASDQTGLSVLQPKISPDGRWLLFTMCRNGNFPIYQANSDLYVMDLATREFRRLEINSDQADSWHSWSSSSRWMVFSSKRLDGLFARPHFSYVDATGRFHKPFVLPQADPGFYDACLKTFNVPEFMRGPVTVTEKQLGQAILKPRRVLTPKGAAPASGAGEYSPGKQMRE